MKISTWWWAATLWLVQGIALTLPAAAQQAQRVVVLPFDGPAHQAVRSHVVHVLSRNRKVELVPSAQAEAAARDAGTELGTPESFVAVGTALDVAAFVEGTVVRDRGDFVATLQVRDASTGRVLKTEPYRRKKPAYFRSLRGNFWKVFGGAIMGASVPVAAPPPPEPEPPPPAPPPEPAQQQPDEEKPADEVTDDEPGERKRPALVVDVLPGLMWRDFDYTDADSSLRDYTSNGPAFIMGGGFEWYPAAHFVSSRLGDLGVEVAVDGTVGLQSNDGGEQVDTIGWDMLGGLLYRIPVSLFTPKIHVGYAKQVFKVDVDPNAVYLPKVNYSSLRFGAGCAFEFVDMLELEVDAAYLFVLDAGNIQSDRYFPNGTAGGIDLGASFAVYFLPWMGAVTGVEWRRYGHDFQADPSFMQVGGQKLAGGATDRYLKIHFGLRFRVEGR